MNAATSAIDEVVELLRQLRLPHMRRAAAKDKRRTSGEEMPQQTTTSGETTSNEAAAQTPMTSNVAGGTMATPSVTLPQASAATGASVVVTSVPGDSISSNYKVDFETMDANSDGSISRREASGNADLMREFHVVDINKNGRLTREEMKGWLDCARSFYATSKAPRTRGAFFWLGANAGDQHRGAMSAKVSWYAGGVQTLRDPGRDPVSAYTALFSLPCAAGGGPGRGAFALGASARRATAPRRASIARAAAAALCRPAREDVRAVASAASRRWRTVG